MAKQLIAELGAKDTDADVAEKLAVFVSGAAKFPFAVALKNKGQSPLVIPSISKEIIKSGDSIQVTINELSEINDLFYAGHTLGQTFKTDVIISVELVAPAGSVKSQGGEE